MAWYLRVPRFSLSSDDTKKPPLPGAPAIPPERPPQGERAHYAPPPALERPAAPPIPAPAPMRVGSSRPPLPGSPSTDRVQSLEQKLEFVIALLLDEQVWAGGSPDALDLLDSLGLDLRFSPKTVRLIGALRSVNRDYFFSKALFGKQLEAVQERMQVLEALTREATNKQVTTLTEWNERRLQMDGKAQETITHLADSYATLKVDSANVTTQVTDIQKTIKEIQSVLLKLQK